MLVFRTKNAWFWKKVFLNPCGNRHIWRIWYFIWIDIVWKTNCLRLWMPIYLLFGILGPSSITWESKCKLFDKELGEYWMQDSVVMRMRYACKKNIFWIFMTIFGLIYYDFRGFFLRFSRFFMTIFVLTIHSPLLYVFTERRQQQKQP